MPIICNFYEEELSGVNKRDVMYRIEKVPKRKKVKGKTMASVKWWVMIANTTHGYQRVTSKTWRRIHSRRRVR